MLPSACENGINAISYYMMEEGMQIVGKVAILGNAPCVRCHAFPGCEMSGLRMIFGPEATLESVGIHRFEDQPDAMDAANELGKKIAAAVRTRRM
jgi:hypothetical protein